MSIEHRRAPVETPAQEAARIEQEAAQRAAEAAQVAEAQVQPTPETTNIVEAHGATAVESGTEERGTIGKIVDKVGELKDKLTSGSDDETEKSETPATDDPALTDAEAASDTKKSPNPAEVTRVVAAKKAAATPTPTQGNTTTSPATATTTTAAKKAAARTQPSKRAQRAVEAATKAPASDSSATVVVTPKDSRHTRVIRSNTTDGTTTETVKVTKTVEESVAPEADTSSSSEPVIADLPPKRASNGRVVRPVGAATDPTEVVIRVNVNKPETTATTPIVEPAAPAQPEGHGATAVKPKFTEVMDGFFEPTPVSPVVEPAQTEVVPPVTQPLEPRVVPPRVPHGSTRFEPTPLAPAETQDDPTDEDPLRKGFSDLLESLTPEQAQVYLKNMNKLHDLHDKYTTLAAHRERLTFTPSSTAKKVEAARAEYEKLRRTLKEYVTSELVENGMSPRDVRMISVLDDLGEAKYVGATIRNKVEAESEPTGFAAGARKWFYKKWASWGGATQDGEEGQSKHKFFSKGNFKKIATMAGIGAVVGGGAAIAGAALLGPILGGTLAGTLASGIARGLTRAHIQKNSETTTVARQQYERRLGNAALDIHNFYPTPSNGDAEQPLNYMPEITGAYAEGTKRAVWRNRRRLGFAAILGAAGGSIPFWGPKLIDLAGNIPHWVGGWFNGDDGPVSPSRPEGEVDIDAMNADAASERDALRAAYLDHARASASASQVPGPGYGLHDVVWGEDNSVVPAAPAAPEVATTGSALDVQYGSGIIQEIAERGDGHGNQMSREMANDIYYNLSDEHGRNWIDLTGDKDTYMVGNDVRLSHPDANAHWHAGVEADIDAEYARLTRLADIQAEYDRIIQASNIDKEYKRLIQEELAKVS